MPTPPSRRGFQYAAIQSCLLSSCLTFSIDAFQPRILPRYHPTSTYHRTSIQHQHFAIGGPSVVEDPDGPTPIPEPVAVEEVDPEEIDGLREVRDSAELPNPIPHQPWRRGVTAGCEDPINAEWRKKAEREIYTAVEWVEGKVVDVTWFLTTVMITIDDSVLPEKDFFKDEGPPINVEDAKDPMYFDPDDPNPEDIWEDEDDVYIVRETPEERAEAEQQRVDSYAPLDDDDDPEDTHCPDEGMIREPLLMAEETREDYAHWVSDEVLRRSEEDMRPFNMRHLAVDTAAISTIAKAIVDALTIQEEELRVLGRHEVILAAQPRHPAILETQKQFDAHRDDHVLVYTVDPWKSNRTLKGQLVDRNSMDVLLNIKGRLVTVPLNFVRSVYLAPGRYETDKGIDEEVEIEDGDDDVEIDGELLP